MAILLLDYYTCPDALEAAMLHENATLRAENDTLRQKITDLRAENDTLRREVSGLAYDRVVASSSAIATAVKDLERERTRQRNVATEAQDLLMRASNLVNKLRQ